jgi:hypothetical protein
MMVGTSFTGSESLLLSTTLRAINNDTNEELPITSYNIFPLSLHPNKVPSIMFDIFLRMDTHFWLKIEMFKVDQLLNGSLGCIQIPSVNHWETRNFGIPN